MATTISCDPGDLAEAAKCFQCLDDKQSRAIEVYLMAVIAGGSTDPNVLLGLAKDFVGLDQKSLDAILVYLLCQNAG